jgi:cell division protein FtsL
MNLKARTHKFLFVYVVLLCGLAMTRYVTRETYPNLIQLEQERDLLMDRQAELRREVDSLEGVARVQAWARANGMIPWTIATQETNNRPSLTEPAVPANGERIEVRTQWR